MLWLSILISLLIFVFHHFSKEGIKPPLYRQWGIPLLVGGSIPHQRGRQALSFLLTWGLLTCFTPPFVLFGLAYCDPVLWMVTFIMRFTIQQHQWAFNVIPSALQTCPFQGLQPHHITWSLHQSLVDAPVDVHGRGCNFLVFLPQGSFTGRLSGDHLTIVLLWHPLHFTS